jgi:3-oxoacyl-[acyl-carrier protein] reductase
MDLGLEGKVALVAGASKGLGRAVALGLAREGVSLAICARGEEQLSETATAIAGETGATVWIRPTDVSSPEETRLFVQEAVSHYGTVHILVNNAGGPPSATFLELTDELWQQAVQLNLLSAIWLAREAVPHMQKGRWGRIINMTSVAVKQPIEGLMLSNAVRAGVVGFAKTLANELAADNILVNNVCPGYILTDRVRELSKALAEKRNESPESIIRTWEESIPLRRLGEVEEFANLVVFLASERASYITGNSIQIDGGYYRGLL